MVGFLTFENAEQLKNGVEVLFFPQRSFIEIWVFSLYVVQESVEYLQILEGKNVNNKSLKIADVLPRTFDKNGAKNPAAKLKSAREAVTPLADLSYADQLEQKKASIAQMLKKLVRNFLILFRIFRDCL